MLESLALLLTGFAASFFSALAGGGAGLLQFPALVLLNLSFAGAVATHKVAVVALGVGSTSRLLLEGKIEWRFLFLCTAFGLPGVVGGTRLVFEIPDRTGKIVFGLINMGMGLYSILRPALGLHPSPRNREGKGLALGCVWMSLVGLLAGLVPSGPGVFATLLFLLWFGLDFRQAAAYTMIMVALFWNAAGAVTAAWSGPVHWPWVPMLVVGGIAGGYLGSHMGQLKGNTFIKRCYETLTLLMGASLVFDGLFRSNA